VALLGVVIGSEHSHLAITGFKIPLHATTWECINSGIDYWNGGIVE